MLIFLSPIGNFNGHKKIIENTLTFPLLNKVLMCLTRIHGRKDQEIPYKLLSPLLFSRASLGTGHYLSPGGGGAEDFRGDHFRFLGEQKGGSVVTENPKEEIAENFGRIQRGEHSNLLGK